MGRGAPGREQLSLQGQVAVWCEGSCPLPPKGHLHTEGLTLTSYAGQLKSDGRGQRGPHLLGV